MFFHSAVFALDSLYSRNLGCEIWNASREREICKALERQLEWTWMGHAIISPSFRVKFETARRVYCTLPIGSPDTASLVNMVVERKIDNTMASAQLLNGARFLLLLLGPRALSQFPTRTKQWDDQSWQIVTNLKEEIAKSIADPLMVWNPSNPHYLLRDGCK